jgi:hypothetical protein
MGPNTFKPHAAQQARSCTRSLTAALGPHIEVSHTLPLNTPPMAHEPHGAGAVQNKAPLIPSTTHYTTTPRPNCISLTHQKSNKHAAVTVSKLQLHSTKGHKVDPLPLIPATVSHKRKTRKVQQPHKGSSIVADHALALGCHIPTRCGPIAPPLSQAATQPSLLHCPGRRPGPFAKHCHSPFLCV